MSEERLQKVLAHAGIASRRRAEEMIVAGRVAVNGEIVTLLGTRVNVKRDVITVDGKPLGKPEPKVYLALNKPRGILSAAADGRGRKTVVDLVRSHVRLYPVGRLDLDSEGLIILTNDGALALRLAHPRYEHEKEYRVLVEGHPANEALQRLRQGVAMEGGLTRPARVRVEGAEDGATWLNIVLREGRKRQIRRMLEIVGHPVLRLIRVRMGPIELGSLRPGTYRTLARREVEALQDIRRPSAPKKKQPARRPPRKMAAARNRVRGKLGQTNKDRH